MEKKFILLICVLFISTLSSQIGQVYSNKYVGIELPIPHNWFLVSQEETAKSIKEGFGLFNTGDQKGEIPGKPLIFISKYNIEEDTSNFNDNLLAFVFDIRNYRDEIKSGKDYLENLASGVKSVNIPGTNISRIGTESIGGRIFYKLLISCNIDGQTLNQIQLAKVQNDYMLILCLSASNMEELNDLIKISDGIKLYSVSEETDSSNEAQEFRKSAALIKEKPNRDWIYNLLIYGFLGFVIHIITRKNKSEGEEIEPDRIDLQAEEKFDIQKSSESACEIIRIFIIEEIYSLSDTNKVLLIAHSNWKLGGGGNYFYNGIKKKINNNLCDILEENEMKICWTNIYEKGSLRDYFIEHDTYKRGYYIFENRKLIAFKHDNNIYSKNGEEIAGSVKEILDGL